MSETALDATPAWLRSLLGIGDAAEGDTVSLAGRDFVVRDGILRDQRLLSDTQAQTGNVFGYKWNQRDSFGSPASRVQTRGWLDERYGDIEHAPWWSDYGERPVVVDAGCGAALSAVELFRSRFEKINYLGVDVSNAIDVALERLHAAGVQPGLLQADITVVPIPAGSVDVIISEGVLHHTDSTEDALRSLVALLGDGGRIMFYVYRLKGPVREFTDDYLRERLQAMTPDEAWSALMPLTKLGQALGDLGVEVEVPESIDLLDIPAGPIDVQRLFYWHVCKMFHHPELSIDELNHINFDWFAPRNAHRQTEEQVRRWCEDLDLVIEREVIENAGITVIARRSG